MILLYLVARNANLANEFRGLHPPQTAPVAGGDSWRDCFAMVVKNLHSFQPAAYCSSLILVSDTPVTLTF
jgi:hypothetical protein